MRNLIKNIYWSFIVITGLVAGCAVKTPNNTSVKDNSMLKYIEKHEWKLIQMNGEILSKTQPTISFDLSKGSFYGSAGCNRYFGEVKFDNTKVNFSKIGMTMMLCDEERNTVEQAYTKLLNEANFTFDVADQTLNFYLNNKLILMFARANADK